MLQQTGNPSSLPPPFKEQEQGKREGTRTRVPSNPDSEFEKANLEKEREKKRALVGDGANEQARREETR